VANASIAIQITLGEEGGIQLTNIPGDRGGMTYAGIARNANPGWEGWPTIDSGGKPSLDAVVAFYKLRYWDPLWGDKITSQGVADAIYDFGVNAGVSRAVTVAQLAIGAVRDGQMGPNTLKAINADNEAHFCAAFADYRLAFYNDIVRRNPEQAKFIRGWTARAERFRKPRIA